MTQTKGDSNAFLYVVASVAPLAIRPAIGGFPSGDVGKSLPYARLWVFAQIREPNPAEGTLVNLKIVTGLCQELGGITTRDLLRKLRENGKYLRFVMHFAPLYIFPLI